MVISFMAAFGHDFKGRLNLNPFVLCINRLLFDLSYVSYFLCYTHSQ